MNAVAELKYRVVFSVSDITGKAAFVGFDKEVSKLTNVLASEAAHIVGVGVGVDAQVDSDLPRSLADIVGNTYTFQLKLRDFNFTPHHQTFTISRIFTEPHLAPIPSFAEGGEDHVSVVTQTDAPRIDAVDSITCSFSGHASSSDGPPKGRGEKSGEDVALEASAPKKARVE